MRLGAALVAALSSIFALSLFTLPAAARKGRPLRQHVEPRALLDVCVYLDADVLAHSGLLGIPLGLIADLNICLCLSALPLAIETDVNLKLLVDLLGTDAVAALLKLLINDAPGSRHCTYPPHSKALCKKGDPCGFQCDPPYVPKDGQCVCAPPNSVCNGVCGSFPHGCGSAVPVAKRNLKNPLVARSQRITTQAEAQATCLNDETVCGVERGSAGFECLNTGKKVDSCGGCMVGSPYLFSSEQGPKGIDCTQLPNVAEVGCSTGRCVVKGCKQGFKVTEAGDACEAANLGPLVLQSGRRRHATLPPSHSHSSDLLDLDVTVNAVADLSSLGIRNRPVLRRGSPIAVTTGDGNLLALNATVKPISGLLAQDGHLLSTDTILHALGISLGDDGKTGGNVDVTAIVKALMNSNLLGEGRGGALLDVDAIVSSLITTGGLLDLSAVLKALINVNLLGRKCSPNSLGALVHALLDVDGLGLGDLLWALGNSGLLADDGNLLDLTSVLQALGLLQGGPSGRGGFNVDAVVAALLNSGLLTGAHPLDVDAVVRALLKGNGAAPLDLYAIVKALVPLGYLQKPADPVYIIALVKVLLGLDGNGVSVYLGTIVNALGLGGLTGKDGNVLDVRAILNVLALVGPVDLRIRSGPNDEVALTAILTALVDVGLLGKHGYALDLGALVESLLLTVGGGHLLDLHAVLKLLVDLGLLNKKCDTHGLVTLVTALLGAGGGHLLDITTVVPVLANIGLVGADGNLLDVRAIVQALVSVPGLLDVKVLADILANVNLR